MNNDPIIIFCSPRGGSSLVAGVFARHGFWTGKTFGNEHDGKGTFEYVTHENAALKRFMKETFPLEAGLHRTDHNQARQLHAFCEQLVPPDVPWLFKGPSEYYNQFALAFPKMRPVMVFRDARQAVEAHVRRYGEKVRENAHKIVVARYNFMNNILINNRDASRVDADRLVHGDLGQVAPILSHYGIDLDHRLAMDGISPDMFHQ